MNIEASIKFMEREIKIQQEMLYIYIISGKNTKEIDENINYLKKSIKELKERYNL